MYQSKVKFQHLRYSLFITILWCSVVASTASHKRYVAVTIRALRLQYADLQTLTVTTTSSVVCSILCSTQGWCRMSYFGAETRECVLTSIVVSPYYQETEASDLILCFTDHVQDYHKQIINTYSSQNANANPAIRAIDGFWPFNADDYLYFFRTHNNFFTLDFGSPRKISSVQLYGTMGATVKVYAGNQLTTTSDFSGYDLLGSIGVKEVEKLVVHPPKLARFVGVHQEADDNLFVSYFIVG